MKDVVEFSKRVLNKFKDTVKAVVLFGSVARGEEKEKSDVDVMIIFDDTVLPWTPETITFIFEEIGKILDEMKNKRIHANAIALSYFIEGIFKSDPIVTSFLKDGNPVYDSGIFMPMKRLFLSGKLKSLPITYYLSYSRALIAEGRAKWKLLTALLDVYWAMILATESLLLKKEIIPEDPSRVIEKSKRILPKKYHDWLKEIYDIQKKITRYEKRDASAEEVGKWLKRMREFIDYISKEVELKRPSA